MRAVAEGGRSARLLPRAGRAVRRRAQRVLLPRRRRRARRRADEIDAAVARGDDPGLWAGVPMGVKELAQVEGWPDTHASMLLPATHRRRTTAPRSRGCAPRARCSSGSRRRPSSARSSWTRSYLHGVTRNPWNPERTPGGSSGGSAAAVAVGHVPGLHRQRRRRLDPHPVVVLRACSASRPPSAASATREAFDCALTSVPGPMCRSVRDAARYVDAIAGPTVIDPTSLPKPAGSYEDALLLGCRGRAAARASAPRGRRRSASRCATPRSRSSPTKPRSRSSTTRGSSSSTSTCSLPKPGPVVGHPLEHRRRRATTSRPRAGRDRRRHAGPARRLRDDRAADARSSCCARCAAATSSSRAIAAVFDEVDLLLTPTTATTAFVAEGRRRSRSRASASAGWARCRSPRRSTSRAARGQHPGRASRRRPAGRAAGRRPPPRRRARARVRRARRGEPPLAQVRADGVHLNPLRVRYPAARDRTRSRRPARTDGRPRRQEQEPASEEVTEVAPGVLRMQLPIWMPGLGT